jgi:hypothetical protein
MLSQAWYRLINMLHNANNVEAKLGWDRVREDRGQVKQHEYRTEIGEVPPL